MKSPVCLESVKNAFMLKECLPVKKMLDVMQTIKQICPTNTKFFP